MIKQVAGLTDNAKYVILLINLIITALVRSDLGNTDGHAYKPCVDVITWWT